MSVTLNLTDSEAHLVQTEMENLAEACDDEDVTDEALSVAEKCQYQLYG